MVRRATVFADKAKKAAKPGDIPVEQPMKFELIINLKAAKADRPDDSTKRAGAGITASSNTPILRE